jgi:hypothetical protein
MTLLNHGQFLTAEKSASTQNNDAADAAIAGCDLLIGRLS